MNLIRPALIFTALLVVAGCDAWLPEESELRNNFSSNRDAFETIIRKIDDTDYIRVSLTSDPDDPGLAMTQTVLAELRGGEFPEQIYIRDDPVWSELLRETGAAHVFRHEDTVELDPGSTQNLKNGIFHFRYVYDKAGMPWRKACQPEHETLRCGLCVVELEDNWFIHYSWSPTSEQLVPTESIDVLDERYEKALDRELASCQTEGFTAIGYDEKFLKKIQGRRDD